jgi:integrase
MIRAVLRIALDHEGHWKRLTANVSDLALRVPVVRRAKATAWTQEQAARFLSAARGRAEPLEALWLLAPTTGMRLGELLGLHWSDIDWERGVIHVQRNLVEIDSKIVGLYEPKTEAGKRDVEVTQPVLAALKRQRAALLARGLAAAPMVFPTGRTVESAGYWLQGNVRRELRKVIARTEVRSTTGEPVLPAVPALSFHKLRHTSATLMLAAGVDVKIVSHRLGHSRVGVTQDLYQHVLTDMQRPAAEALDAVLGLTGPKK